MMRQALLASALVTGMTAIALSQEAPTDPQIAHIAYYAGEIDIKAAEQALAKSTNPDVLEFARQMVADHEAVNEQALALVTRLGVTPEDNPTSQSLSAGADARLAELEALDGPAFDAAYMANEAAYHATVNGALRDLLIPSAANAELKALLETGLMLFTDHETRAEALVAELS